MFVCVFPSEGVRCTNAVSLSFLLPCRTGVVKMLENKKPVQCLMCKKTFDVLADVEQYNKVVMPSRCLAKGNTKPCNSYKFQMVEPPPGMVTLTFYLKDVKL